MTTFILLIIGFLLAALVVVGVRQMYMLALASQPRPNRPRLAALFYLADNPLSYVGLFLVNSAAVTWIWVMPVMFKEGTSHPYLGIFFIAVLPMLFIAGLALLPIGAWYRYRRQLAKGIYPEEFKPLSWENPAFRHVGGFVVVVTGLNVLVGGYYSQTAVKYMDSSSFCGTTCHTMAPEWTAYQDSPHKNVACVDCHVGSGRRAKLESKLNGIRQVWMMARNTFSRPIPTPVHNLRPARDICESCHWPEKFGGVSMHVLDKFEEDEGNTYSRTVMVQQIGGGSVTAGIHGFHVAPGIVIDYRSDPQRESIPWVRYVTASGDTTEYFIADWDPSQSKGLELRSMDCMDCHTRPSHQFKLPRRALDQALGAGDIDRTLPWIYKSGLEVLRAEYSSTQEAEEQIPFRLEEVYRERYPAVYESRPEDIRASASQLVAIYRRNVFPEMGVEWGTYPDNSGHSDFPGCFRCHDDRHTSPDGRSISTSCQSCHELLAVRETDPAALSQLGVR